ncbi:SurA N-terminal domain-containing protein [Glaciecola sp. XM2]|uniref:SurA N-terminal domain-containing protein n=1 Tax=Glaciecola sp. XM2 TaxID=1914931 RepID=UPI001BDE640C|nr:SurA N-terminal domain-containing protein [Glaciecola sp. XM2]MBT1452342.1 SurA N-terminal domain-containing protein [Glaciecola sp. XM2]
MLERIREGVQGPWAIAIVALIVVSFVFTGVGGYLSSSASTAAAIVNDTEISDASLEVAYQNERARMEAQFGDAISSLFASESYLADFRASVLDRLINDELISQKAFELGLRISDEQIREAIVMMPEFQIAGQFNNDTYNSAILRAGFTPGEFAEYMRTQMTRQQLVQALNGSSFSVATQASMMLGLQRQTRDVSVLEVSADNYLADVTLTEEEIQQYYNDTITQYDTQEQVRLAYVSLSVEDLKPRVDTTDEEVLARYEEQQAFYQTPESRTISHILIESSEDAEQARVEAEAIVAELAAGASFAQLASEKSDDLGSAEVGGELGPISRGDYPQSFEDAVFALTEAGQITDIVETEFGFHIIKLDTFTESVTTPFEEVAEEVREELLLDKATDLFFSLQSDMQRLAFEIPDSLEDVAELTGRPVFETALFPETRYPAAVAYPQVENVAFSPELIEDGVNSDLLRLSDERVMVVRVVEHEPQRTMALDEVRSGIETALKADKAQQQALTWAQTLQTKVLTGEDTQAMLSEKSLTWNDVTGLTRNNNSIPRAMINAAFELSTDPANSSNVVTLANGNVGIVKLNAVNPVSDFTEEEIASTQEQLRGQGGQRMYQNFVEALRENAKIEIVQ